MVILSEVSGNHMPEGLKTGPIALITGINVLRVFFFSSFFEETNVGKSIEAIDRYR